MIASVSAVTDGAPAEKAVLSLSVESHNSPVLRRLVEISTCQQFRCRPRVAVKLDGQDLGLAP